MLRRAFIGLAVTAAVTSSALSSNLAHAADETGTLKMKFVYGGKAPAAEPVNINKDIEFCGKTKLFDETLIVNPENKGIKNVIVYVYTSRRGGSKLPEYEPSSKTYELANDECRFEPHILIMQTGDTLKVTNPDEVGHNANMQFIRNEAKNLQIPPGGEVSLKLDAAEPAPIPVDCNIHPWMRARVVVLEHPFVAKSDENGVLEIKGLPAGDELVFRVYAEAADGPIKEVMINGKKTKWRLNRFEVDVKPGENDMGTIEIPAAAFGK